MTRAEDVREIAIEAAAIAMGRARESTVPVALGMRQRRQLAELAFPAIVKVLAREIREEGDQAAAGAEHTGSATGKGQGEGLRAAAVLLLNTATVQTQPDTPTSPNVDA